ncbi:serine hydrolase domain-containing protein [Bacteroidota bacterium]
MIRMKDGIFKTSIKSFIRFITLFVITFSASGLRAQEFPVSTPSEQGLNSQIIEELIEIFREGETIPNRHSLLIVKNGYLVTEEYFNGYTADRLHMLQSVTKSFTSAAVGLAIEKGFIKSVDEKVLGFFPDITDIKNLDDRKRSMTIKDILTMRTGTDYHERSRSAPHFQLNALKTGWDTFYLNRPMVCEPGTKFQYDSGGVILISAILKNTAGMHADEFLKEHLFKPLGIEEAEWFRNSEGHPHTGGGLYLRPRDMAKFGLLYLQNGKWNGKQILPEWWVRESFMKRTDFLVEGRGHETGYGYLWWIQEPVSHHQAKHIVYSARGAYGQYIFIIPDHKMVVVVTADTKGPTDVHPVEFIYSHIITACNQ